MPARIDPADRRRRVVEAAFRCIVAGGIEAASLRKVAAESGLNVGSVRHYFDGHDDLLAAAAREAGERMGERLGRHHLPTGLPRAEALAALQGLLEEVLPLDAERDAEAIVVVEIIQASRLRPVLAPMVAGMSRDLHDVVAHAIAALGLGERPHVTEALVGLIGGLTLGAVTPHGALAPRDIRATLRGALEALLP